MNFIDIKKDNKSEIEIKSNVVLSIVELEKSLEEIRNVDILPPKMSFCKNFPIVTLPKNIPNDFEAKYKIYNYVILFANYFIIYELCIRYIINMYMCVYIYIYNL